MQLASGTLLQGGKYKIEEKIGQGGFGITYKACQPLMLGRKVCIKEFCLKQHFSREKNTSSIVYPNDSARKDAEIYQQKFIKEAQTLYSIHHSNIMEIYDIFEENNTVYYVMEYIDGESLQNMLERRGCIPESEAIGYIRKVAEALKYIHSRDINHFDVKPANILVRSSDNEVILIDFGTAKHYDCNSGNATTITAGLLSPGYAPIEQYKEGGVSTFTPETDIYALGATLYKLLSGNTPPEPSEIISYGILDLPSSVSKTTKNLVKWTMQLKKADRPHTCDEFLNALPLSKDYASNNRTTDKTDEVDDVTISINTGTQNTSEETIVAKATLSEAEKEKIFSEAKSIVDNYPLAFKEWKKVVKVSTGTALRDINCCQRIINKGYDFSTREIELQIISAKKIADRYPYGFSIWSKKHGGKISLEDINTCKKIIQNKQAIIDEDSKQKVEEETVSYMNTNESSSSKDDSIDMVWIIGPLIIFIIFFIKRCCL